MMIVEGPRKLLTLPTMAAALLLVVLLLACKSPPSEARPVVGLREVDLSATMPAAGVALPKELEVARPELHHARDKGCGMAAALEVGEDLPSGAGDMVRRQKLGVVYGPLLLNMLPRGPTPPSAPSKGTNDIQT